MSEDRGHPAETEDLELGEEEILDETEADEADEADGGDEGLEGDEGERGQEERPGRQDDGLRRPPGRGARRIASLSERARKAEQEAAELRGRLAAQQGQQYQADPYAAQRAAMAEEAELQRVAQLPYEDQIRFHNQRTESRVSQALQRQQFFIADQIDRQGFDAMARGDPIAARLAPQVEALRTQNPAIPREAILNHLYGQEMRAKAVAAAERQRRTGRRRIEQQTTRPGTARSNQAAGRRGGDDGIEAVMARLRGQQF